MPTPAAGSELRAAMTKTPEITLRPRAGRRRARRPLQRLRRGATRLRASPLFAIGPSEPGPALRRGALVAVPVGARPARRARLRRPDQGRDRHRRPVRRLRRARRPGRAARRLAGGGGAADRPRRRRSASSAASRRRSRSPAMALVGAAAGYCFSVSLRLAIFGLSVALTLLISQGLFLDARRRAAGAALGHGRRPRPGALVAARLGRRRPLPSEASASGWDAARRARRPRAPTSPCDSESFRHALRFGAALARRRRHLPALRHGRPRLLDPADDPLRDAPGPRRDLSAAWSCGRSAPCSA